MQTRGFVLVVLVLALGVAGGCCGGSIKASAIGDLVEKVSARHDALLDRVPDVNGDGKVDAADEADKATYKRSSALLRQVVKEAAEK